MRFKFVLLLAFIAALTSTVVAQEPDIVQVFQDQQAVIDDEPSVININAAQLQLIVNVEVACRDAGVVKSINVTEGKEIFSGDILVQLDQEAEFAGVNGARSELDIAKEESENDIDLRYAKVSEDVSSKVYQRSLNATKQYAKSVSITELEQLKLEVEKARLSGEQAERTATINELTVELRKAQFELASIQLDNREIASPVGGVVVQVYRQVGEWVKPGQPIARIIDLKTLRVSCRCQIEDALPESIAEDATFFRGGKEYKAKVVFASPEIDPDVQDFIVWAEVDNSDRSLKPGMSGSIELQLKK